MLHCYDLHGATLASRTEWSQQLSAGACTSRCSKPSPPGWSTSLLSLFLSHCERNSFSPPRAVWLWGLEASNSRSTVPASPPAATPDRQGGQLSCVNDAIVTVCRRDGAKWPAEGGRRSYFQRWHMHVNLELAAIFLFGSTTDVFISICICGPVELTCCGHW